MEEEAAHHDPWGGETVFPYLRTNSRVQLPDSSESAGAEVQERVSSPDGDSGGANKRSCRTTPKKRFSWVGQWFSRLSQFTFKRGKALAGRAASSPGQRAAIDARGSSLRSAGRSSGHRSSGSIKRIDGESGAGEKCVRGGVPLMGEGQMEGDVARREPRGELACFAKSRTNSGVQVSDPEGRSTMPPPTPRIGCDGRNSRAAYDVGDRSRAGTPAAAGMREDVMSRHVVDHEPQGHWEGCRNTGDASYINSCLQGLLSLPGFATDLQRKCWVQAMLTPLKKSGGSPGDISAGLVSATALSAVGGRRSADGGADGGSEGDATLYAALLRLAMQARVSDGVMDASQLKRAMGRHSDRFAGNLQQDAHEFLIDLISTLHEETQPRLQAAAAFAASLGGGKEAGSLSGRALSKRIMPTMRHFHAEVEGTSTCTRCAYSRRRRKSYRDFSLDVPSLPEEEEEEEEDELGISELLDGFFKPSVLNRRCERCGEGRVWVQRSLAQLPGALVLEIKRFKPLVSSPGSPGTTNTSSTADGVSSTAGSKADPPLQEMRSSWEGSGSRVSGGQSCSSESGTRGAASYEKLMTPVFIPTELDLERFCSSYTINAPTDDLGEVVDPNKMGNRNKSDSPAVDRARVGRGEKRRDDDSLERWADRAEKRRRGEDGTALPAGGKQEYGNLDYGRALSFWPKITWEQKATGVFVAGPRHAYDPPSAPWTPFDVGVTHSPAASAAADQREQEDVASHPRRLREGPLRARYQLEGVLHHFGQNAFTGHYVTDVREVPLGEDESEHLDEGQGEDDANEEVGRWKRYDNGIVFPVSEATALDGPAESSAYICFYSLAE